MVTVIGHLHSEGGNGVSKGVKECSHLLRI
nr:MAG TPA: hypothetical protein [Caudoviricetes sp.]